MDAFLTSERVQQFKTFISANSHILISNPALVWQQALNEPTDTLPCKEVTSLIANSNDGAEIGVGLMEWANKPQSSDACTYTINNLTEVCASRSVIIVT